MYGFTDVFIYQNVNIKMFPYVFKQRVVDVFIHERYRSLECSPVLHEYRQSKTTIKYEQNIDILSYNLRCVFLQNIENRRIALAYTMADMVETLYL